MTKKKRKMQPQVPPGFRAPKKPTKKQLEQQKEVDERKAKIQAYFKEYGDACVKYGLQLNPKLVTGKKGIYSVADIIPHYEKDNRIKNKYLFVLVHYIRKPFLTFFNKKRFMKAYTLLCIKHKLQLDMVVEITNAGIAPKIGLANYKPQLPDAPEIMEWDEAKKENVRLGKEADSDRKTLSEAKFKEKWPDRPYVLKQKDDNK